MGFLGDELKNVAKDKSKKLGKKILMKIMPYLSGFAGIILAGCIMVGIFEAIVDTLADLLSDLKDTAKQVWAYITDDYWTDMGQMFPVEIVDEETGNVITTESKTVVDQYMDQLNNLGISLKDLKLLGEADYSDEEKLLENEDNRKLVQKYITEFVRADLISQSIHKRNKHTRPLVNPRNENEIDGGVFLYRTNPTFQVIDFNPLNENYENNEEYKIVSTSNGTIVPMEFEKYDDFMRVLNDVKELKYTRHRVEFNGFRYDYTIAKESGVDGNGRQYQKGDLLYYKIDSFYEQNVLVYTDDINPDTPIKEEYVTLTLQSLDYKFLISKYAMPLEFLINLCMVTQNPEFVYHVAFMARDTTIQLLISDSIHQTITSGEIRGDGLQKTQHLQNGNWVDVETKPHISNDYLVQKVKIETISTPELHVLRVNTWSHALLYKVTNHIVTEVDESAEEPVDNIIKYSYPIDGSAYTNEDGKLERIIIEWSNCKLLGKTIKVRNEFDKKLLVGDKNQGEGNEALRKSKQFLGLIRNSTGKCINEDIESCVAGAVFNKNGKNIEYKIPNSTRTEAPYHNLKSGAELLCSLLSREIDENDADSNGKNTYNEKMQGLEEYVRYLLTFPDNETFDLSDGNMNELINDDDDDGASYGVLWWPLDPSADCRITSNFGPRVNPVTGEEQVHGGVDIAVVEGVDVIASASGIVTISKEDPGGYGYYIKIDHQNGFETLYAHNSELLVSVGDSVERGQVIAKSGNTGRSTGPHLHFEVRVNGVKEDPLNYVSMSNKQPQHTTYEISDERKDVIYAVVAQECAESYEGALAVITCVLNRCDSAAWEWTGGNDPYAQITYPGQFAYSEIVDKDQKYKQYLGGKAPKYVQEAVDAALISGIRNHTYTSFRTATDEYKEQYPNGKDIGGNWYF